ncbi:hypothetical protein BU16DRAFT_564219 [Lophium mytilinum]|uniref:DUF7730 domain-containing protein n=1 Tax=Lophium mytilinum TaxID=390894 RepID=A0A6A6QPT0_9PEZI|nr:hypothetical protein BU16DRAFT_564219 [Lophium mytilinum]
MFAHILEKVRTERKKRKKPKKPRLRPGMVPPQVHAPLKPPITLSPCHDQAQSPLFGKRFPAELRIAIYEAVLGDPVRLMHIVPHEDGSKRVGHRRCIELDCPYPTWQHKCFGKYEDERGMHHRRTPQTHDKLLSLLVSCRLIYSDAIGILYTANYFSLKGARGMLEMRSIVPAPQWHAIRYLHVSTLFLTPRSYWLHQDFPPENYINWADGCKALQKLQNIRSIRFEILVKAYEEREDGPASADVEALVSILEPLKDIKAPSFEVETNFVIPDSVQAILGDTNFSLKVQHRPYRKLYGRY